MRSVPEWIARTDDTAIPTRVRLRVFERASGHCNDCRRKLFVSDKWECDHVVALINGGENRESNLQVLCGWCHRKKTGADVAEKSKVARVRNKHLGIRPSSYRPLPGTKASGVRKRMNGAVERWEG